MKKLMAIAVATVGFATFAAAQSDNMNNISIRGGVAWPTTADLNGTFIGAGIDFHAGTVSRAPQWMRDHGLEWFYRLVQEPRRLWRRYLVHNTLFVWGALGQFARHRRSG